MVIFFAFLAILPFLYTLFAHPYFSNVDESLQLQAAIRLANGQGYTATLIPQNDLSTPNYSYLIGWPIGYSFLLSILLKIGFSIEFSAKLIKGIVLIVGMVLWLKLFNSYAKNTLTKISCISLLGVISPRFASSCTDLMLWAIFPLLTLFMLSIKEVSSETRDHKKQRTLILTAGVIISVAIIMKYLGLVFLLICLAWLIFVYRRKYRDLAINSFLLTILPFITGFTIFYTNKLYANSVGPVGDSINNHVNINFGLLQTFDTILYIFIPPGFLSIVTSNLGWNPPIITTHILSTFAIFVIGYVLYKICRAGCFRELIRWFILAFALLFLFLGFLSLFLWNYSNCWNFLIECRYYYFVSPFILFFVVEFLFSKVSQRGARILAVSIVVMSMIGALSYSGYRKHKSELNYNSKFPILNEVQKVKSANNKTSVVVIADDTKYNLLFQQQGIPSYSVQCDQTLTEAAFFSKPTLVFIISNERPNCPKDMSFNHANYPVAPIYWKVFNAGRLFSQI
jgi:hypothetical protein